MNVKKINGLGLCAAAVGIVLAGCATTTAPKREAAAPRAKTPVARELETQASAFESFMRKARAIEPGFSGPGAVSQAVQTGAGYEPQQLEAGMIAYAALAALQEPQFVSAVEKAGRDRRLAQRLASEPTLAMGLPGGEAAAGRASAALYRQGDALADDGQRVKKASYGIQRQAWAKAFVPDPRGRLNRAKGLGSVGYRPAEGDRARLYEAVSDGGHRGGPASPVVTRGVALAALAVLGEDGKGRALMSEPKSGMCLRLAKLNYHQCLASAGPHYEDIYCLGQHAMIDPGQCVVEATKPPRPVQRASVTKASYRR